MRKLGLLRVVPVIAALLTTGVLLTPKAAFAWGRVGFFFDVPLVVAPPVYLPPPIYVAPPPVYYRAPTYYAPPHAAPPGFTCYAGPYVCPLAVQHPINGPCSCPSYGGREAGVTR